MLNIFQEKPSDFAAEQINRIDFMNCSINKIIQYNFYYVIRFLVFWNQRENTKFSRKNSILLSSTDKYNITHAESICAKLVFVEFGLVYKILRTVFQYDFMATFIRIR